MNEGTAYHSICILTTIFSHPKIATLSGTSSGYFMTILLAYLEQEAAVVGAVCLVFLVLFVVAGIRQIYKEKD